MICLPGVNSIKSSAKLWKDSLLFVELQLTVMDSFRLVNQAIATKRVNLKGSDKKTEDIFKFDEINSVKQSWKLTTKFNYGL